MSVRHAILGILQRRPTYPYELVQKFERMLGETWQLNQGQVYQVIKKLEHEGLIERKESRPNKHGRKWTYEVTEAGKQEYSCWRGSTSDRVKPLREDLLLKIALASKDDAQELLAVIERRRWICEETLHQYQERDSVPIDLGKAKSLGEAGKALSADIANEQLKLEIRWLDMARTVVERLKDENNCRTRKEQS